MTIRSARVRQMIVAGVVACAILAGSRLRIVGDGAEYVVQALNFSALDGPSLGRQSTPALAGQLADVAPEFADWDVRTATVLGVDGRRDYLHFWFYALLSAPSLWLALAVGAPGLAAFTLTNLACFGAALWVALPRLGVPACVLLFAGPVIWWIDKAHTEVFTFSLLLITLLLARDKPWWAFVAAGMASTQNLPIAAAYVLALAMTALVQPHLFRDRRVLAGAAAGALLIGLHPAYTYVRYGTPSLLLRATTPGLPTPAEMAAVVFDPTLGLIGNYPMFFLVGLVGLVLMARRGWRTIATPEMTMAAILAIVFLYAFARTANFHHGATPSLSRYGLWLVPLLAPVLVTMARIGGAGWRRFLAGAAVTSACVSVSVFHPGVEQNSREPTWAATWLWTSHPGWQNPLPEIFSETLLHQEGLSLPVATPGCEKVLLLAASDGGDLAWPLPCYPVPAIEACQQPGTFCYANRQGDGYRFVRAPGRQNADAVAANPAAWTAVEAAAVVALFEAWGWGGAAPPPFDLSFLRQAQDVSVMTLGTPEQFLVILGGFGPSPALRFRLPNVMTGRVVDPQTGETLIVLEAVGGSSELWTLELPAGHPTLILTLTNS